MCIIGIYNWKIESQSGPCAAIAGFTYYDDVMIAGD